MSRMSIGYGASGTPIHAEIKLNIFASPRVTKHIKTNTLNIHIHKHSTYTHSSYTDPVLRVFPASNARRSPLGYGSLFCRGSCCSPASPCRLPLSSVFSVACHDRSPRLSHSTFVLEITESSRLSQLTTSRAYSLQLSSTALRCAGARGHSWARGVAFGNTGAHDAMHVESHGVSCAARTQAVGNDKET